MHELAITQGLLDAARRHAAEAGAVRVTRLHLLIGEFSTFVDESVQFYWDMIAKGTVCEGAELSFRRTKASLLCLDCGREYTLAGDLVPCPDCGSSRVRIAGGDEFRLESMDIETDEAAAEGTDAPRNDRTDERTDERTDNTKGSPSP
jgi:hydrogenase nickel incorporation protein HypA/HybF